MISKILIFVFTILMMVGNAQAAETAERLGLEYTLLCGAEYFSEHQFTTEPLKVVDAYSGISSSNFLVSTNGVQWIGGSILSEHCKTTDELIICEIFSGIDETTFTVFRDSSVFRTSYWGAPPDGDEHAYYDTFSGACSTVPGTYNPDALVTLARAYLMTTTASPLGNVSELHIINTSSAEQQFSGTLYEYTGTQLGGSQVSLHPGVIAPHGRLIITSADLENILGIVPWKHPAVLDVFGSAEFELMIKLTSPSGFVSNTNCVTDTEVHNIGGSDSPGLTFIRFINIGDTPSPQMYASLYDEDGNYIGIPLLDIGHLSPREQIWVNSNTLSSWFGSSWTGAATLKIISLDSLVNIKLLNLNFVDSQTFFNFSCFESSNH